jgi:adenylate kinase family enzyme
MVQRVVVVGSGGAGKSTFAAALGEATGLPVVHLDRHFWHPGRIETPREEWRQRQRELFAGERWIADGNYGGTFAERFARADTVIIVARGRLACLASALWRTTKNHGTPVQADGCPEHFQPVFYRWIWNYRRDSRPRLDAALARHPDLEIVEFTNCSNLRQFLVNLDARCAGGTRQCRSRLATRPGYRVLR